MSIDPASIRILAVDDHPLIRVGIATLVAPESDMKLVGEASNGREGIAKFRECHPDVTLMDLQMPDMKVMSVANGPRTSNGRTGAHKFDSLTSGWGLSFGSLNRPMYGGCRCK